MRDDRDVGAIVRREYAAHRLDDAPPKGNEVVGAGDRDGRGLSIPRLDPLGRLAAYVGDETPLPFAEGELAERRIDDNVPSVAEGEPGRLHGAPRVARIDRRDRKGGEPFPEEPRLRAPDGAQGNLEARALHAALAVPQRFGVSHEVELSLARLRHDAPFLPRTAAGRPAGESAL